MSKWSDHPRKLWDTSKYDSLLKQNVPGDYWLYGKEQLPDHLAFTEERRPNSENKQVLHISTAWSVGDINGIKPVGVCHIIFIYSDDNHRGDSSHLNKDVQFIFRDKDGNVYSCTGSDDINDHLIDDVATGTALPFLKQAFRLPNSNHGPIKELIDLNTSIDPYPS